METPITQRWHKRKARYRPAGETINPRHYEVAVLDDEKLAKEFVAENHYLETLPPVRRRFGLYRSTRLVGVAIFTVPTSYKAITKFFGSTDYKAYMDLGRFVLLDSVPSNGESWFLARCLHLLRRQGVPGVMTFADPEPRRGAQGSIVFPGHIGHLLPSPQRNLLRPRDSKNPPPVFRWLLIQRSDREQAEER